MMPHALAAPARGARLASIPAYAAAAMTTHTIRLLDPPAAFEAAPGQSLLEAAQAAGLVLQSSCRNGTCRTCMRKLAAGEIEYRVPWPGLTPDERREGWVLPCVAVPKSDVVLGEVAQKAWWGG
jgi:ferredoxin